MQGYISTAEAAAELHTKPAVIREYARRKEDPFPLFVPPWNDRNALVDRAEMHDWVNRNRKPIKGGSLEREEA
jgi:hypothetical protein